MYAYSNPARETDPHAIPDLTIFELTAEEVVPMYEDEVSDYMACFEFRMASMDSRVREKMYATMIEELGIKGGWFYQYCFPGCLPDSDPVGPFASPQLAEKAAQDEAAE
jgi:hypothetical protein